MDTFLEKCHLSKYNQEEIENLNSLISVKQIDNKTFHKVSSKHRWLQWNSLEFSITYSMKKRLILRKLFQ